MVGHHPVIPESNKRVMIVDDHFFNVDVLKSILLEQYDHLEVADAFSGDAALTQLKEKLDSGIHFDVCFLDLNMPGMSGCVLADRIRELYAERDLVEKTPILLAVTAQDNIEIHPDYRPGQFDQKVLKPVNVEELKTYLK